MPLTDQQRRAVAALLRKVAPVADDLGRLFAAHGHELALVGGSVRDVFLARRSEDLDLTTDAPPERVMEITDGWADGVWPIGLEFGTVGLRKGRVQARDHDLPQRALRPEVPQACRALRYLTRRGPGPAGFHDQCDGGAASCPSVRGPVWRPS